jgi:hypothetical protein
MKSLFVKSKAAMAEQLHCRQMRHAERMHAVELGRPLPEVEIAHARMQETRARSAAASQIVRTVFMGAGPAAVCGVAVGATNVVLVQADPALHRFLATLVWCAAVVVSSAVITGLWAIGRQKNEWELSTKRGCDEFWPPADKAALGDPPP